MMWVKSDQEPFDKAGFLPVNYASRLDESYFANDYRKERIRCYLDNLNLLYVALTRAEQGLIVMAPYSKTNDKLGTVGNLLYNVVQQSEHLAPQWDGGSKMWRNGAWTNYQEAPNVLIPSLSLTKYMSNSWRSKLVIRQHAAGHFQTQENETAVRIKYGIHLHTVLSRIRYRDELNETFTTLIHEGIINLQEEPVIRGLMEELFRDPIVATWFEKKWDVRTEVPVLLPGGDESRIDRLIMKDGEAIVIDFKTGSHTKTDTQQVNGYMDTLRKMNFQDVRGYLLYIKTGEVVSLTGTKSAKSAKQDQNQLGLDL